VSAPTFLSKRISATRSYYTELGLLKDAGLSDTEVLNSATRIGAEILRLGDKLGVLRDGMLADILVVGCDPREDIQHLRDVRLVMADGRIVGDRTRTVKAGFQQEH